MAQRNFIKMSTEVNDGFSISNVLTPQSQTGLRRAGGVDVSVVRQVEVKVIPRMSAEVSDEEDDDLLTPVQACD